MKKRKERWRTTYRKKILKNTIHPIISLSLVISLAQYVSIYKKIGKEKTQKGGNKKKRGFNHCRCRCQWNLYHHLCYFHHHFLPVDFSSPVLHASLPSDQPDYPPQGRRCRRLLLDHRQREGLQLSTIKVSEPECNEKKTK